MGLIDASPNGGIEGGGESPDWLDEGEGGAVTSKDPIASGVVVGSELACFRDVDTMLVVCIVVMPFI